MRRVGPALVVFATVGSTLFNLAVAVWRWGPSFFQLGLSVAFLCVPVVVALRARKLASTNDVRGFASLVVVTGCMIAGAALLTFVPSPYGWSYLYVPFAQTCVLGALFGAVRLATETSDRPPL